MAEEIDKKRLEEILKSKKVGTGYIQKRESESQKAITVTRPPQSLLDKINTKPKDKK